MRIEVHALLCNEARMIPYFMLHYSQFAEVFFYESNSSDGSREIATILGANVIDLPCDYKINENAFTHMKNNCWKNSKADWVITADTDEFVYHPDIVSLLKRSKHTIIQPQEWRMISRSFPTINGQIYDEIKYGFPGVSGYGKMNIFRPDQIRDMNYAAGCHSCNPVGNVRIDRKTEIKTLHFHDAGLQYRLERNRYVAGRISDINIQMGWGIHHTWPEEKMINDFEENMKKAVRIID